MAPTAEERVFARLREALTQPPYRLYPNVRWLNKPGPDAPASDGETDLLIAHPEHGLLVVEAKGGQVRRDGQGRWFSGEHPLKLSPFEQAERGKHALRAKLASLPDWPGAKADIRTGHAVAFPDVSVRGVGRRIELGTDTDLRLVIDATDLGGADSARAAVERAFDYWLGDGRRGQELSSRQLELIDRTLAPTTRLPALRAAVDSGEAEVLMLERSQMRLINETRGLRRLAVRGPAGTGKTMLAREKARRLAEEGFSTLLVCFNQPLARMLADQLADAPAPGGLDVLTFHELCLRPGRAAGTLPSPEPEVKDQGWWDEVLPTALEDALPMVGGRYHSIVVDEGQDFDRRWLDLLYVILTDADHDVLYVFHDPEQALYREDVVDSLGLPEFFLEVNCRNTGPIHRFAARHAPGLAEASVLREEGLEVEEISAAPGRETLEALRKVLHRLRVDEGVPPWQIAVLTGVSLAKSEVWRQRQFGNETLWNGAYDDAGHSLGLSADQAPEQPTDTILCDSIRRFKGLEREVVVLVELDGSDQRAERLLYVGATRARQHLVTVRRDRRPTENHRIVAPKVRGSRTLGHPKLQAQMAASTCPLGLS